MTQKARREAAKLLGRRGGLARKAKLTRDQLSAIGKHAAAKRWQKKEEPER